LHLLVESKIFNMSIPVNLTEMDREVAVATNPNSSGEVYIQTHAHQLSEGVAHLQNYFGVLIQIKYPQSVS